MKLTKLPAPDPDPKWFSEDNQDRSPGLHLSQVLDLLEETLYGNPDGSYVPSGGSAWSKAALFSLGFIWERVLTDQALKGLTESGRLIRPGEVESDGIVMTPDGYCVDGILEEWKCTFKSSGNDIAGEKFRRWWWQIKSYCRAVGVNRARLRVLFVMGDWRGSGPQWKGWEAEFTDRELEENWSMVLNEARRRKWL